MRCILVASDLSPRSDRAIQRGGMLAREFGAELLVLHIVEEDRPARLVEAEKREARALLEEQMLALSPALGVKPRIEVESGDVHAGIIAAASAADADLIVMGTHRRRFLEDILTGTTIERVLRLGTRPVLMVVDPPAQPYRRVVAAVDLSEASARALTVAAGLGLLRDADVRVLHAYEPLAKGMLEQARVSEESIREHVAQSASEAMAALRAFIDRAGLAGPRLWPTVEEGSPAQAIARVVAQDRPDLVVIGSRGHSSLMRLLLGSVAERLLRELECDVLAVPTPRGGRVSRAGLQPASGQS